MSLTVLVLSCRRLSYLLRTVAAARAHFETIERDLRVNWVLFDNGSSEEDQRQIAKLGLELVMLSSQNLGQAPALNLLLSTVKTPYFLLLEDDWVLENPGRVQFVREATTILEADPRLGQIKLDALHMTDFEDRKTYSGPFTIGESSVRTYVQNPDMTWGGFCCPPAITRTDAVRRVGPFLEEEPFRKWWAESEYSARFSRRYFVAKSPDMLLFKHIGDEESPGWKDGTSRREIHRLGDQRPSRPGPA